MFISLACSVESSIRPNPTVHLSIRPRAHTRKQVHSRRPCGGCACSRLIHINLRTCGRIRFRCSPGACYTARVCIMHTYGRGSGRPEHFTNYTQFHPPTCARTRQHNFANDNKTPRWNTPHLGVCVCVIRQTMPIHTLNGGPVWAHGVRLKLFSRTRIYERTVHTLTLSQHMHTHTHTRFYKLQRVACTCAHATLTIIAKHISPTKHV